MSAHNHLGLPCALLAIGLLTGCGKSASGYVDRGNALFNDGKFSEAEINYRKALQKDSASADASYHLALSLLKQNKPQEAYQALLQTLRLAPDHPGARAELTNLALPSYIVDPQHPKALYDLLLKYSTAWLAKDPRSLEGLRIKAYLAMEERRPEEAAQLFRRALEAHPGDLKMTLGLIDALYRNNQRKEAEKTGLDFIAADPAAAEVYDAMYRLFEAGGRTADAEDILVRKVRSNPKNSDYLLELAGHYARLRKKAEMEDTLAKFLANAANDPTVHLRAGDFFATFGDWPRAEEQYRAGLSAGGADSQLYQNRMARSLLMQNKREESLKILNDAVKQHPDGKESRVLRDALLLKGKESNAAITELKSQVEKNPEDLFLKVVYAKALLDVGDPSGARVQFLDVVKSNPHYLDAQAALAKIEYQQGNLVQAVQSSGAVLAIDPNNYAAQLIRGSSLRRLGNLGEAASALERLSRQSPGSIETRLELAYLELNRRQYVQAEAAFQKMLSANPNDVRPLAGLVDTDLAQNRTDKAFGRLEQEVKRTHGSPAIYRMMANVAIKTGKYSMAVENFRKLADLNPTAVEPLLDLANVLRERGDIHGAISALNKAALNQPADPRPGLLLPYLLETDHRTQDAKQLAKRALSQHPDDPHAMNNLAFLLAETGESLDEALKLVRQALAKVPGQPNFTDTLGYVLLKREQNEEALGIFEGLLRKYPNDPTCGYHLGMALFQSGDRARAKAVLSRSLQKGPPPEIGDAINDLLKRL